MFLRLSHGGDTGNIAGSSMRARCGIITMPTLARASTGDVGIIIETFPVRQFPNAAGHYWVINETPWNGDEMIVDVHTIVNERRAMEPTLSHFCC